LKFTLRLKFIILSTVLVTVIMTSVTYFFTIRELEAKGAAVDSQMQRIAQNIATMQLLDRQEWSVYQNYISQLMAFNQDIVYIAIYDDRNTLRAHTLNSDLIEFERPIITRRMEAELVRRLDNGAVASENKNDLRSERVNIQLGGRVLGSVHVGFSIIDINRELRNGILLNIGLGLFFIIVASILSVFISRRLTRPLEKLSKAMEKIREGNLEQKVEPETHDEIARLAHSFNQMIDGLRERQIIETLGYELSATFHFERLAPLVREHLKNAIGAGGARLYIRSRYSAEVFHEITVSEEKKRLYPPIELNDDEKAYLLLQNDGFMIHNAPPHIMTALNHSPGDEEGLLVPMAVKDELFGMLFLALPPDKQSFDKKQRHFAALLAGQAAIALENTLLYEELREQERLKRELEIAREMQRRLLPGKMPQVSGFNFDGICQPAYEVGGDYFDFFYLDENHLGVVIADVSGKGTSASFYMAELKGMMVQLTTTHFSPKKLLAELNRRLFGNIERQVFVTMIYGVVDMPGRRFTFSRAGHNPLLKIGLNGTYQFLTPSGIGLGLDPGEIFEKHLEEVTVDLKTKETLILYTDGLNEARNAREDEFGEERILNSCMAAEKNVVKMREKILSSLKDFVGDIQPHDDISMVLIQRLD
jgi:serine phosphatase RsbU (regulator of sigma subunit)/HAMP domain-containing protein